MNILRGGVLSSSVASLFEIRLSTTERDVIVLQGDAFTSEGTLLKGVLVLSLTETIQAKNITLSLRGKARAHWGELVYNAARAQVERQQRAESIVFEHTWSFLPFEGKSKTVAAGNYEYPFEVFLPGDIPESVEGLQYGSVRYNMLATIERPSFAQNLVARKHLRVIRALSMDSFEMASTSSVDNTWPDKIEYAISTPTKYHPIGASITINLKLVPLKKGLTIQKITCVLKEYQSYAIEHGYHGNPARKDTNRDIAELVIEDLERDVNCWDIEETLQIPTSLNDCTQDCEVKYLTVRHRLRFTVTLKNPDGHVSELRAALQLALLIPPNIFSGSPSVGILGVNDPANQLPSYNSHVYDRLYDGVETPLPSGMNTPAQSRSRRGSFDGSHTTDTEQQRRALMAGLNRLTMSSSLQTTPITIAEPPRSGINSGSSTPGAYHLPNPFRPGSFTPTIAEIEVAGDPHSSAPASTGPSPGMIPIRPTTPPAFTEEEMANLNRIPSYNTAAINVTTFPISPSLPTYPAGDEPASPAETPSSSSRTGESHVTRPPTARTASHRTGILRSAHERFARARDQ